MDNVTISDAGHAVQFLSRQLELAETDVLVCVNNVLAAQERLRVAIDKRDTVQKALNLTAQHVARETL